jgi:hypothetical protein
MYQKFADITVTVDAPPSAMADKIIERLNAL